MLFLKWITKPKSRVKKQRRLSWITLPNERTKENTEAKRWIKRKENESKYAKEQKQETLNMEKTCPISFSTNVNDCI